MIKTRLLGAVCAVLLAAIPFSAARAITVHVEFSADFLSDGINPNVQAPPPDSLVSGWFRYEADTIYSAIDSSTVVTAVDLTIDDYVYKPEDLVLWSSSNNIVFCSGESDTGACGLGYRGRDFVLEWEWDYIALPPELQPKSMRYSTADINDIWRADPEDFNYLRITAIPIPPAFLLFGSGLLGLIGTAYRKRTV